MALNIDGKLGRSVDTCRSDRAVASIFSFRVFLQILDAAAFKTLSHPCPMLVLLLRFNDFCRGIITQDIQSLKINTKT